MKTKIMQLPNLIIGSIIFLCSCQALAHVVSQDVYVRPTKSKFDITLAANATTGYQWTVSKFDNKLFKLVEKKYISPDSKLIGAGGHEKFTFQLLKGKSYPKKSQMEFIYARPWEPKSGMKKMIRLHFKTASSKHSPQ